MPADSSELRATRLKDLLADVDLPAITGIDCSTLSHPEIAALLPRFGGDHPMKGILIDKATGKAYGIASGWIANELSVNGITYKSGSLRPEVAAQAGRNWQELGFHVEPVAAAFMRKMSIADAAVYINGTNPCWGRPLGTGCYYRLSEFLPKGATLSVYNKYGLNHARSSPDRKFHFTGLPD